MPDLGKEATNPNVKPDGSVKKEALKAAREKYETVENAPAGYIPVRLSTVGKVGAPELFYARNFSPEDIMNLGLVDEHDLPIRTLKMLDSLIYNPDPEHPISVKDFHEKEVIELILLIYETFYTEVFADQTWVPIEEDYKFLEKLYNGKNDEYYRRVKALENGDEKPRFDLNIAKDITFYNIEDVDFKKVAHVERKYGNETFTCEFSLPRYGDFLQLKYFIDDIYGNEDTKWAPIGERIKVIDEAHKKILDGEHVDMSKLPIVSNKEREAYKEYESKKAIFSVTAAKALYITEFNGEDVSHLPLEEKIEMARDARLDYATFKDVQEAFDNLKFGYKEEITVKDPITQKITTRPYTFQLADLLQAIQNTRTAETTITLK